MIFVLLPLRNGECENMLKPQLIMGSSLCLPLPVLLGYVVAAPMELGSLAVVVFVFAVTSLPLLPSNSMLRTSRRNA